jgi:hypothetical protein
MTISLQLLMNMVPISIITNIRSFIPLAATEAKRALISGPSSSTPKCLKGIVEEADSSGGRC